MEPRIQDAKTSHGVTVAAEGEEHCVRVGELAQATVAEGVRCGIELAVTLETLGARGKEVLR
jgi:hypothetical protein